MRSLNVYVAAMDLEMMIVNLFLFLFIDSVMELNTVFGPPFDQ